MYIVEAMFRGRLDFSCYFVQSIIVNITIICGLLIKCSNFHIAGLHIDDIQSCNWMSAGVCQVGIHFVENSLPSLQVGEDVQWVFRSEVVELLKENGICHFDLLCSFLIGEE